MMRPGSHFALLVRKRKLGSVQQAQAKLDFVQQAHCSKHCFTRLRRRLSRHRVIDMALEDFHRNTIHCGPRSQNLRYHLLARFAIGKHANDTANLSFDTSQPHLNVVVYFFR